ncbi:MAG: hypothetical protein CMJ48_10110, partial [Planctomycetaceae bacterium]|nr:hypothetical protein [Planctomycetaceae bacterium]
MDGSNRIGKIALKGIVMSGLNQSKLTVILAALGATVLMVPVAFAGPPLVINKMLPVKPGAIKQKPPLVINKMLPVAPGAIQPQ